MNDSAPDEMERLLARMELVEPPAGFLERSLARARAETPRVVASPVRQRNALYAAVYLLALAGLVVLAYELGLAIARSGTTTLIGALLANATLLPDAPAAYLDAIAVSLPWLHLVAVAIDLAILLIVTRLVVGGAAHLKPGDRASAGV